MAHAADDVAAARVPAQAGPPPTAPSTAPPGPREREADDSVDTDSAGGAGDVGAADVEADTDVDDEDLDVVEEEGLGQRDLAMLEFERRWWKRPGAKEQAIRDEFGLTATRYYQLLNVLLDDPAALEHDPVLVQRLRRVRSTRTRTRTA